MNENQIRKIIAKACAKAGGQDIWAEKHELSASFVSYVISGKKDVTEKIAKAVGYERVVTTTYRRILKERRNAKI